MNPDDEKGIKMLAAQISSAISEFEFRPGFSMLSSEYGLGEYLGSYLLRKEKFGDWAELREQVHSFLLVCLRNERDNTILLIRRLAHEIVSTIPKGSSEEDTLKSKFPAIVNAASQPISGSLTSMLPSAVILESYIDPAGYSGLFLRLIVEINRCFSSNCPIATAMLSRKLMESLLVSIMQKKYGDTNPEYFMKKNKKFKMLHVVSGKFWKLFNNTNDLIPFSPVTDPTELSRLESLIKELKEDFNVDVHQLGVYASRDELLVKRDDLIHVLNFLKHLHDHVQ